MMLRMVHTVFARKFQMSHGISYFRQGRKMLYGKLKKNKSRVAL